MKITVITLFPDMIRPFFDSSIMARAQKKREVLIDIVNLRDFAKDKYRTVDGRPYGGGVGMVLMAEPLYKAIGKHGSKNKKTKSKMVLTSPRGRVYTQSTAQEYAQLDHLVLIAGHYEGVDERILEYIDEEVSIGDFVMTGGEIAATVIVDSVVRLLPGVLRRSEATQQESFMSVSVNHLIETTGGHEVLNRLKRNKVKQIHLLEYPHYTRPENFRGKKVPAVLLSGDHKEIEKWRLNKALETTLKRRPDFA